MFYVTLFYTSVILYHVFYTLSLNVTILCNSVFFATDNKCCHSVLFPEKKDNYHNKEWIIKGVTLMAFLMSLKDLWCHQLWHCRMYSVCFKCKTNENFSIKMYVTLCVDIFSYMKWNCFRSRKSYKRIS
jgi:hypothetical protein